jgi:hypothetical protein
MMSARFTCRIEPTWLPPDTAGMAKKPEPPKPMRWGIYKIASNAAWLGTVDAPDDATAIEKGAAEFRVPALRCYVRGRMALARPRPSITPHPKGSRLQNAKGGRGSPLRGLLELT